ncbi:polymer-forming cytoskeletal protein [Erwinia billingiae]|uniref:bactofilin family protein n=1 Tax=Erwinia billingiae TaxID=182337 RepID=UPI0030D443FF
METFRKEHYLWGLWLLWIFSLCCYLFPQYKFFDCCLRVTIGCYLIIVILTLAKRMDRNMFNFNKKETDSPVNGSVATASSQAPKAALELADECAAAKETRISSGSKLTGEIINEANISINGQIVGDIISKKTVQIGQEGKVNGKVSSLKVVVNGLLKGCCYAKSVTILSRGRIEGDVYAEDFSIEKGGVFIGNSHVLDENRLPDKASTAVMAKPEISELVPPAPGKNMNKERSDKAAK